MMLRKILLPVILGAAVIGAFISIGLNMSEMDKKLKLERYSRISAEQKLDEAMKDSRRLEWELDSAKKKLADIQEIIDEGQSTASQLKSQVEASAKEKQLLEQKIQKLQEDLVTSQKAAEQLVVPVPVVPEPVMAN